MALKQSPSLIFSTVLVLLVLQITCCVCAAGETGSLPISPIAPGDSTVYAAEELVFAPLNPDFQDYLNRSTENTGISSMGESGHLCGYFPSPVELPRPQERPMLMATTLEPEYDLRDQGMITPVKDQGYYGTCWSFASLASLESTGIPTSGIRDYSEKHVVNLDGFDPGVDDGGDSLMSTAYLTRWEGPVYEEEDPYPGNSGWTSSPAGLSEKVHCQDVLFLPCDLTRIKEAVKETGAVSTNFIVNLTCFKENETHATYYYNGSPHLKIDGGHAVTIVGWDDTYDRSEFAAIPPGDGAIICKNSWGTDWGDAGYFYLSYYDESFNSSSVQPAQPTVFTAEPVTNYDNIYQYDPYGWVRSVGVLGAGDFTYAANVFNASGEEQVAAVGFYTPTTDCDYVIYIYRGSEYVAGQCGTIGDAGFHTVALDNPAGVRAGETFTVYLGLKTPGYDYPICVEVPIAGYSSNASASPGESYISGDGTHWADISSADTNVCLKAYTQAVAVPDFMANVTGGPAPLTVRFTDCSAGSPTA